MKKRLVASAYEVTQAPVVGKQVPFSKVREIPGVYALGPWAAGSARVVVLKDKSILYVNNNQVDNTTWKLHTSSKVWCTSMPAPDEITVS